MLRRSFLFLPFLAKPLICKSPKAYIIHSKINLKISDNTAYIIAFVNEELNYITLYCYGYTNHNIFYSEFYEPDIINGKNNPINTEVIVKTLIFSKELKRKYNITIREIFYIYFSTFTEKYSKLDKILALLKPNPLHSRM